MRVVYLVTVQPGLSCGVVDYTRQLARALARQNIATEIEELPTWSLSELARLFKRYKGEKDAVFHIQYPTLGMGKSFAPALLPLLFRRHRVFITLHEFSQFHFVRKLYFLFARLLTKNFIFTNEPEQKTFARFFPWAKTGVILPIGNNINVFPTEEKRPPSDRLAYFGQIAPGKGLEAFLETVSLLRARKNKLPCILIGALIEPESALAKKVRDAAQAYAIDCLFNAPAEIVSRELQKSSIALLPFPQGVGDKRGSALTCLKHGLTLLTKHTALTPEWWRQTTYDAPGPEQAARTIEDILTGLKARVLNISVQTKALKEREWEAIALRHQELYRVELEGK